MIKLKISITYSKKRTRNQAPNKTINSVNSIQKKFVWF